MKLPTIPDSFLPIVPWWRALVGAAVAAPLFFMLGQCDGRKTQLRIDDAARAEANVQAMGKDAAATEQAAQERVNDALTVTEKEKGLVDAIAEQPDSAPDAVRVRLGCERLRQQGTDTSALPACRRPASRDGGQADSAR